MKRVNMIRVARPVKVLRNSSKGHQWGQIKDAVSGEVLHTGRLNYIRQVAKKRYNMKVNF